MSDEFLRKYPKAKHFLEKTGMTLDQALIFTEIEINKLKKGLNHTPLPVFRNMNGSNSNYKNRE